MTKPLKPLKDLVLIQVEDKNAPTQTAAGITIPPAQWAKPSSVATVTAIGRDVQEIQVGRQYVINPYAVIDTKDALIKLIKEKDILAECPEE